VPDRTPIIYIIAGCNGAGKTTFAREYLPHEVKCLRFLNADELARGLSPLDPGAGAFKAGRLLLKEIHDSISKRETFALETTLSGRTYVEMFREARDVGYSIELHYLWLASPAQAIARVRRRVRNGGHDVPAADVRRRFHRSLEHLIRDYLPLVSRWTVWDNRRPPPKLLAQSERDDINQVAELLL
jgi:predicted ABC-type ATPase